MQRGTQATGAYQAARGGSALMRLLGGILQNRMSAQRGFHQQMRTQDPAYQRGMQGQYLNEYNKFNTTPKPPKPPKSYY